MNLLFRTSGRCRLKSTSCSCFFENSCFRVHLWIPGRFHSTFVYEMLYHMRFVNLSRRWFPRLAASRFQSSEFCPWPPRARRLVVPSPAYAPCITADTPRICDRATAFGMASTGAAPTVGMPFSSSIAFLASPAPALLVLPAAPSSASASSPATTARPMQLDENNHAGQPNNLRALL